jgi:hypothetical protein
VSPQQTPPASAAWCFNFNVSVATTDTTGFSRVVLQFQRQCRHQQTPPASAAWCFNFNLTQRHDSHSGHHQLQPRGASIATYRSVMIATADTTGFSRVVLQFH